MNTKPICPNCENEIDVDSPGGLCPECLLHAAVSDVGSSFRETLPRKGLFQAPSPETLSAAIDSVEVSELLGHGGMGAVYRARQINLDRPVALKILAPKLSNDPGFEERFSREAKTLARLNHPNIVTVYDFGRAGEYCYLVMELIEGVNLRDAIQANGITAEQALEIVPRICEALQYAHDKGVVHRDIKPENILVGLDDTVKIADFGLAKLLDHSEADFTLTATQQILGTRNYMAPEQIEKPLTVDHRADIYSLGVVFYELLTGELPLGRFSLPSEKANVNDQMDDVVLRTLEKEPGRRYQQASEVKTAVESIDLKHESPLQPINGKPSHQPAAPEEATNIPPHKSAEQSRSTAFVGRSGRRISVPFRNDEVHAGLSNLQGIAHLNENAVEIEFRVHKLGVAKSAKQTVSIPYHKIVHSIFSRGMFSCTLEIHAASLEVFDDIPGTSQGCLKMTLDKKHEQLVEEFRNGLDSKISSHSSEKYAAETETPLAHVPFKIGGINSGFSDAIGIAKVTSKHVIIEYEVQDALGVVKSVARRALVPLNEIISVECKRGLTKDTVEIQTNGIDTVSAIPNSAQGKFKLSLKKRDRELAAEWMRPIFRSTGMAMPEFLLEQKPMSTSQRKSKLDGLLTVPRNGLLLVSVVNATLASATIFLVIASNWASAPNWMQSIVGFMKRSVGFSPNPGDWVFQGIIGPLLTMIVALICFVLIRKQRSYPVAIAGLAFLIVPWHFGAIASVPIGITCLAFLLNGANKAAYISVE